MNQEHWMRTHWRPLCAYTYLIICLFDFVIVPMFIGLERQSYEELIPLVKGLESSVQMEVLQRKAWEPLTLKGGGMFHLAFGALLTGAAVTRGLTNKAKEENKNDQ